MREWTLPERAPGEENEDWCRRAAESIPAESLMRCLVAYLDGRKTRTRGVMPTWSIIGDITGHGSGVSREIASRFREKGGES